jgi:threonine/homoserine/homoserine lactone efflux protein
MAEPVTLFIQMLALGFFIGLSGALAPGPTLIATINASVRGGWTMGPKVTLGHMLVELVMVILIIAGISTVMGEYSTLIALIGGIALFIFGVLTLVESRTARIDIRAGESTVTRPFVAGVLTSISNPYFWIWWLSVGSSLLIGAAEGGIVPVLGFIIGHWSADMAWLTVVSTGVHKGRFLLGERQYRWTLGICGLFLIIFGLYYLLTVWT